MARGELKWQNIDADDLPAAVKKSFDAMVEAEATFKADLEKLLKDEGHMPEDKFLVTHAACCIRSLLRSYFAFQLP
jgi:hypothetical protein